MTMWGDQHLDAARREPCRGQVSGGYRRRAPGRGFTLIDVLVTVTIITILIGILLPSMSQVHESARRLACRSNVRQIGLGMAMYADAYKGHIPPSVFVSLQNGFVQRGQTELHEMMTLRLDSMKAVARALPGDGWDGVGLLFSLDFLPEASIFYCPSHHGDNPASTYVRHFGNPGRELIGNYHYRGFGPTLRTRDRETTVLSLIEPAQTSLLVDGFRTQSDYNHRVGANVFRADLSVGWFADPSGRVRSSLPVDKAAPVNFADMDGVWGEIDSSDLSGRMRAIGSGG